jgi:uncharacterized protein involved in outer membrane biogenesis
VGPRTETSTRPQTARRRFLGKWRKPAVIVAGVLALYAVIGFLVVPPIAKSKIVKLAAEKLHRQATVRYLHFNPFTFTVAVGGFDLRDRDGSALFAFDRLVVDLQLSGLFRRAWKFRVIEIERPRLVARVATDGKLSAADLLTSGTPSAAPAKTPRIIVGRFTMDSGRLDYVDESRTPRFAETLAPVNLEILDLNTLPDTTGDHGLTFGIGPDTRIRWMGTQTLEPLHFEGKCEVTGLSLPLLWRYAAPAPGLELRDGRADIFWSYDVRKGADGIDLSIADAAVAAHDIALRPAGGSEDWLAVPLAEIRGVVAKWPGRTVDIDGIKITAPRVVAALEADGRTNWQEAVAGKPAAPPAPSSAPASAPPAPTKPWAVKIGSFEIEDGAAQFDDRTAAPPVAVALSKFGLRLENLSSDRGTPVGLRASARVNESGEIDVSGTVTPKPMGADLAVTLLDLDLVPFRSYLSLFPGTELRSGKADLRGKVRVSPAKPSMRFEGEAAITALDLYETGSGRLLGWNVARATGVEVTRGPDRVRASRIDLDDPFFRIFISRAGKLNLSQLAAPAPKSPGQALAPAPATPVDVVLVALRNATLDYTDESLVLPFDTRIYATNGTLRDLSTTSAAAARLDLEGRIAENGFFKSTGTIQISAPFTATDIGASFLQVPMPGLTPYFAQFAGYSVEKGALDVDVRYTIKDRRLVGQNKVVMTDLVLGPKVPGAKGPGLPIRLAIALLKDKNGRIDLNVPVEGTVDSPEFNYGKLFWSALKKILLGLVTAPFRAIGHLFGSSREDLDLVGFSSGSSEIPPGERETLAKIAGALADRPALTVEVGGRYDPQADVDALRRSRLEARIDAKRTGPATLESILESLYAETFSAQQLAAERAKFEPQAAPPETGKKKKGRKKQAAPPPAASTSFNAVGFYEALRTQLLDAEAVGTDELKALAEARAAAVIAALTAPPGGVDPSRVKMGEPKPVARRMRGSDLVASEMTLSAGD